MAVLAAAGGGLSTSVTPEGGGFGDPAQGCGPHVWLSPRARAEFGRFYLERNPCRWGFPRSSLEAKPPSAVDLMYVSALGLGLILDAYLDASEVMFLFGRLYWTLPFWTFIWTSEFGRPYARNIFHSRS